MEAFDILIVGAGPAGLAAACEAQELGLTHVVVDRRGLAHSFGEYPQTLRFFSPPDEMAIDRVPFAMRGGDKPTREDALAYYRAVASSRGLNLATWESVVSIARDGPRLRMVTRLEPGGHGEMEREARAIILATGVWDQPRRLSCPGADRPHVFSRFHEPTEFLGHPVLVVGGGNSAVTAALALAEAHARVTLAMRRPPVAYQSHLRPFIVRDLEFAVDEGRVDLRVGVVVNRIEPALAWLQPAHYDPDGCTPCGDPYPIPARFVFTLLGQTAETAILCRVGLSPGPTGRPRCNPETFETEVPGIYVAGSLASPDVDIVLRGREQARRVVHTIAGRLEQGSR